MQYQYRALNGDVIKKSRIEAHSEAEVVDYLHAQGFFPIEIKPAVQWYEKIQLSFLQKPSDGDITHFTREIAIMLNAGLTLTGALDILESQTTKASMRTIIIRLNQQIRGGKRFSEALGQFPGVFTRLYVALVKAGEASGKLNEILATLANDLDKQQEYLRKVRGALVYPAVVLIASVLVVFVMVTFVVPRLLDLYRDFQIELPMTTQILIFVSDFFARFWPVMIIVGIAIGLFVKKKLETYAGKYAFDRLLIRAPIVGQIIVMSTLVTATRTMAILIGSGVLVLESIGIVIETTHNYVYQQALRDVYKDVEKGSSIGISMANASVFPPILVQMTTVGEETGKLDEILLRVSNYFEAESDVAIKSMTTLIEPAVLILLGGIVVFIVLAVLSPIYTLTSSFK